MAAAQDMIAWELCEDIRQLQAIARISRSLSAFSKSLKEKCMECIFQNAKTSSSAFEKHSISPVLRRDFLKRLEVLAEERDSKWTDEELERVFGLVRLLLDQSSTEFDFKIYGERFEKDQLTWRLLAERCPNLTRAEDLRPRTDASFPDELLRLRGLQHVKLRYHICSGERLRWLAEALPGLRTLGLTLRNLDVANTDLWEQLFKLQRLQIVLVGISDIAFGQYYQCGKSASNLVNECVRRLPWLQEVAVSENFYSRLPTYHNTRPEVLGRPLALTSLRVKHAFRGWTCEQLPHVTSLLLHGPLTDASEFLGFANLTVLSLTAVAAEQVMRILRVSGPRLRELKVTVFRDCEIDLRELLFCCRSLRSLYLHAPLCEDPDAPGRFPLSAANYENLTSVSVYNSRGLQLAWAILREIFQAPRLERLKCSPVALQVDHVRELSERLRRREILQRLRQLDVTPVEGVAQRHFLKLVYAYGPRLKGAQETASGCNAPLL